MSRLEKVATSLFVAAMIAAVGFMVTYSTDGPHWLLGVCLAATLGFIAAALVTWSNAIGHKGDVVQQREDLEATKAEQAELSEAFHRGSDNLARRRAVLISAGAAIGGLVLVAVTPLRSLAPTARVNRRKTAWAGGRRLVLADGSPLKADSLTPGGMVTAFPEGDTGDEGTIVVISLPSERLTEATVKAGAVGGVVAYSKICTHAGCAVGLFQADDREPDTMYRLLCPCHQSLFDPADSAKPIGGPATRPLPQLPLIVDDDGNLNSTGDFPHPVGPAFWGWP